MTHKRAPRKRASRRRACYYVDGDTLVRRPVFTKEEAKAAVARVQELTGVPYMCYECWVCQEGWHIRREGRMKP